MIIPFRALVRKDIQLFFVDRRALLMSFAIPIAIGSFFGYVLGGAGDRRDQGKISVLTVDQDGSAISREIVKQLSTEKALEVKASTPDEARVAVRKGSAMVAVIIPPKFGQDAGGAFFGPQQKPEIAVLYDPSHAAERSMAEGILTGTVMQAVSKEMFTGETGRAMVKDSLAQVEQSPFLPADDKKPLEDLLRSVDRWNQQSGQSAVGGISRGLSMPYTTREEAVTARQNVKYNGYAHAFAGMVVQFVLFLGIDVGIGLLQQRQRGLWKRFRAAPLSRGVLLGSRAVSAAILAFLVVQVNFLFARLVFGVRVEGSMAGFLGSERGFRADDGGIRNVGGDAGQNSGGDARVVDFRHVDCGDAGRGVDPDVLVPAMAAEGVVRCADPLGDGWPGSDDVAGAWVRSGAGSDGRVAAVWGGVRRDRVGEVQLGGGRVGVNTRVDTSVNAAR